MCHPSCSLSVMSPPGQQAWICSSCGDVTESRGHSAGRPGLLGHLFIWGFICGVQCNTCLSR